MPEEPVHRPQGADFTTTRWTLVREAGDVDEPSCKAALEALCQIYWVPVYAYVRRSGKDVDRARDLTQGFFVFLLESGLVAKADRQRGRFRSFLLSSVKNFLLNDWDRERAQKRGGGETPLSLDFEMAEGKYRIDPRDDETPESIFERRWAQTVVDRTLDRLRGQLERSGHASRFRLLRPFLTGSAEGTYTDAARHLEMTESAVKVAVHRMRRRFGSLLRSEVAQGLANPDDVDAEIRYLFGVLKKT